MGLYWMSFSLACISLACWFFSKGKVLARVSQLVFLSSTTLYVAGLVLEDAPLIYRLQVLARDFLFLGVFGGLFAFLSGFRRLAIAGIVLAMVALGLYMRHAQWTTFPYMPAIPLDKNGELLLELRPGTPVAALADLQKQYGLRAKRAFFPKDTAITRLDQYYVVDIPDKESRRIAKIMLALQRQPAVVWVEENEEIQLDPVAGETRTPTEDDISRYGLNDPGIGSLWAFREMSMDKLFAFLDAGKIKPAKKALIAILDTGVDARHEDIGANYTSLKALYDNDPKGHGTHCAGIAAAVSNNSIGIASFSRDNAFYSVTSVKVLGAGGMGTQKMIIDGMLFAVDKGADVLSMSLGGLGKQAAQRAYGEAVAYAASKGAIVVAAAGNSNRDARDFSPANVRGVICVSAVDEALDRALFSNYVKDIPMALAAPGVDIYSTIPGNQYERYSGTSMAAPQVAGIVALLKSLKPELKAEEAYNILHKSGKDTRNTAMTGKFVQPAAAVRLISGR